MPIPVDNGAAFGRGTGPIFLYFVRCTGTESSLLNCSHNGMDDYYFDYIDYYLLYHYCSYYSDAGVVCPSSKLCVWHNSAITVGLVLATIDIVMKFLPAVILTAGLYAYCPVCDFPGRDMCWLYE